MVFVFYRSLDDGWRVGVANSLGNSIIRVRDSGTETTVTASSLYIPNNDGNEQESEKEALFCMKQHSPRFLQPCDAARMSPSPLVGLPPLVELLRSRTASGIRATCIGHNFTLLLGGSSDASFSEDPNKKTRSSNPAVDVHSPEVDTALKAFLAWKGSRQPQVVVVCGRARPNMSRGLLLSCCSRFGATPSQMRVVRAGMHVLSAFTCTVGQQQKSYLQVHLCADGEGASEATLKRVLVEVKHLFTSGIGESNNNNFRIFSYLLYGFSGEKKKRFFINCKQNDFVCQSSIQDVNLIARLQEEYIDFTHAMEVLGIPLTSQLSLYNHMAAIVHLSEIDFYEDGSPSNLPVFKSVARLLRLDFDECLRVFASREICAAAARLLYLTSFTALLEHVNSVFNFYSEEQRGPCSVTVLVIPPLPLVSSKNLENIVLSAVYEDLQQAFLRSSDREVIQWQRTGVCIPLQLQSVLDSYDNYSLLKVLYGLGGVLSLAQSTRNTEEVRAALTACAKHARVKFNPRTLLLGIEHSFGVRQYKFASRVDELLRLKTVHHADYEIVRTFLMENSDVDTQRALHSFAQAESSTADHVIAQELLHLRPLLDVLKNEQNLFWWVGGIDIGTHFRGDDVEMQLKELPVLPVVELRRHLPYRYITCNPTFIVFTFKALLPPEQSIHTSVREAAANILDSASVKYYVKREGDLLVDSASVMVLYMANEHRRQEYALVIQAFARMQFSSYMVRKRVVAWSEAVGSFETKRGRIIDEYHCLSQSGGLCHTEFRELMEEEDAARSVIEEQLRGVLGVIQPSLQEIVENHSMDMVTASIQREDKKMRTQLRFNGAEKLRMAEAQLQQRLERHRSNLGNIIGEQLHNSSRSHSQHFSRVQERFLRGQEIKEEQRVRLQNSLARKRAKSNDTRVTLERQAREKATTLKQQQHRNQADREHIIQTREDFSEMLAVQVMLDDVEAKVARRVKNEVVSLQRQENERLLQRLQEKRQQQEELIIQSAKANERRAVKGEMHFQRLKEIEGRHKRIEAQRQLDIQQRQQRTVARMETARKQQQKKITEFLVRAELSLTGSPLQECRAGGTLPGAGFRARGVCDSVASRHGGAAGAPLLAETSMRGPFESHSSGPRAKSPYPYATAGR